METTLEGVVYRDQGKIFEERVKRRREAMLTKDKKGDIFLKTEGEKTNGEEVLWKEEIAIFEGTHLKPSPGEGDRADVVFISGKAEGKEGLGTLPTPLDKQLKGDLQKTGWKEPYIKKQVEGRNCLECGVLMINPRKNKVYCTPQCKKNASAKRIRRVEKEIRGFKPSFGKVGELRFMIEVEGKRVISFIPANWADSEEKAFRWVDAHYESEATRRIIKDQIKEAMGKI